MANDPIVDNDISDAYRSDRAVVNQAHVDAAERIRRDVLAPLTKETTDAIEAKHGTPAPEAAEETPGLDIIKQRSRAALAGRPTSIEPPPELWEMPLRDAITQITGNPDWAGTAAGLSESFQAAQSELERRDLLAPEDVQKPMGLMDFVPGFTLLSDTDSLRELRDAGEDVSKLDEFFTVMEVMTAGGLPFAKIKEPGKKGVGWLAKQLDKLKGKQRFDRPLSEQEKVAEAFRADIEGNLSELKYAINVDEAGQIATTSRLGGQWTIGKEAGGKKTWGTKGLNLNNMTNDLVLRQAVKALEDTRNATPQVKSQLETLRGAHRLRKKMNRVADRVAAPVTIEDQIIDLNKTLGVADEYTVAVGSYMLEEADKFVEVVRMLNVDELAEKDKVALMLQLAEIQRVYESARNIPASVARATNAMKIFTEAGMATKPGDLGELLKQYDGDVSLTLRAIQMTGSLPDALKVMNRSLTGRKWDAALEFYYFSILSGIETISISAASGPIFHMINLPERLVAGVEGKARIAAHKMRAKRIRFGLSRDKRYGGRFDPTDNDHVGMRLTELGFDLPVTEAGEPAKITNGHLKGLIEQTRHGVGMESLPQSPRKTVRELKRLLMARGQQFSMGGYEIGGEVTDRAYSSEAWHQLHGYWESRFDAFYAAHQSLISGQPLRGTGATKYDRELASRGTHALSSEYLGMSGVAGAIVDILGFMSKATHRGLLVPDEFSKAATRGGELRVLIHRQVRKEMEMDEELAKHGLTPEIKRRIQKRYAELGNMDGEFVEQNIGYLDKRALENALQTDMGQFAKNLDRLASTEFEALGGAAPGRFIQLFTRVMSNAFREGPMRRSPIAGLSSAYRTSLKAGGAEADMARARMHLGTTTMGMAMWAAYNGQLTGRAPSDPEQRRAWLRTGRRPYSIRVPNGEDENGTPLYKWVKYGRLEPSAWTMGVAADLVDIQGQLMVGGESTDLAPDVYDQALSAFAMTIANATTEKSFMTGTSTFFSALHDTERNFPSWANRFASSLIPNVSKNVTRMQDPYMRQVDNMLEAMMNKIPTFSSDLRPVRDVWAEPLPWDNDLLTGAKGVAIPLSYSESSEWLIEHEIYRLGVEGVDDFGTGELRVFRPALIKAPGRMLHGVLMTPETYDEFLVSVRIGTVASHENGLLQLAIPFDESIQPGMNVKEALEHLVNSPSYQDMDVQRALPDGSYVGGPLHQAMLINHVNAAYNQVGKAEWMQRLEKSQEPAKVELFSRMKQNAQEMQDAKQAYGEAALPYLGLGN